MESISATVEAVNQEQDELPSWRWPMVRVLDELRQADPVLWDNAEIVGRWVWIEFGEKPNETIRMTLKRIGFRWNKARGVWQHSCGVCSRPARGSDPRDTYGTVHAADAESAVMA